MLTQNKTKFRIKIDKMSAHTWSFGICISHWYDETYLFINAIKWSISIGFLSADDYLEEENG